MAHRQGHAAALALALACAPALADIILDGTQHIGDCKPKGQSCAAFTQNDPITRDYMFSKPVNFHVSSFVVLDSVQLNNPEDLGNQLQIYLESLGSSFAVSRSGLLVGDTFSLIPPIFLTAGYYVLLPDGGCTVNNTESSPNGFYSGCSGGEDNDFGFSSITLSTADSSTSVMLSRRMHIGDSAETSGSTIGYAGRWYPDAPDGLTVTFGFTLSAARRLGSVEFYRLRDIGVGLQRASVAVDGVVVGSLTADAVQPSPFTVSTGLLLASGSHALTIDMPDPGDADDISWDEIILRFTDAGSSGTPGFFNAVDSGANAVTGSITTKVAGSLFTLDLYALNGFGTGQNTGYTGTATVEVLNAADSSGAIDIYGCNSAWTVAQTLPAPVTFVAGYAAATGTFLDAGLKDARIRITDTTTGSAGCSIDNFAIRPFDFLVEPSHDSETTAGVATPLTNAGAGGLPRHRAGQPFTLVATARAAGGAAATSYDGTPDVSATALSPATTTGAVTVGSWDAASSGVLRTDTAEYSEVGPVTISLTDSTWASVDSGEPGAQVSFTGSVDAGRFVPDHFKVVEGSLEPACAAGGFSYLGGALAWAAPAVTLTAESANNTTTLNYEGVLETLPATLAQPAYAALTGTLDTGALAAPVVSDATAGVATVTLPDLSFVRALAGVFDAEIGITLPAFADGDGILPAESPIQIGAATAGNGVAFTGNAKSQRFGRLYFEPRYGSERLALVVPLRAEYFDGVTFVPNTADLCTSLATADVTLAGIGGQTHVVASAGAGAWNVTLSAPNTPGQATLSIDLASPPVTPAVPYPLLQADTDGDGTYAEDPAGTATFGVYSQDQRWIYQREVVGN